jgi:hypothetical protein
MSLTAMDESNNDDQFLIAPGGMRTSSRENFELRAGGLTEWRHRHPLPQSSSASQLRASLLLPGLMVPCTDRYTVGYTMKFGLERRG